MRITTQVQPNGKILAKGGNRQKTVEPTGSDERENHRHAMHALAAAHRIETLPRTERVDVSIGRAVFVIG